MKKIIIALFVSTACFIGMYLIFTFNNDGNNLYHKKDIHTETRKQLNDPLYQNIISPKQLDEEIINSKNITVYFYSPTCEHCKKVTPIVAQITQAIGVKLKQFNLLEYEEGWEKYHIVGTPTIIHFSNGKEQDRIMGMNSKSEFKQWFEKIKDE